MAIPATFFDKIVADLGQTYGLTNTAGDQPDETSPVAKLCVRFSYAQIMAYTHTTFHKAARTMCYYEVYGPLQLQHYPLDTGETIVVEVDGEVVPDTDYVIDGNIFYLGDTVDPQICYGSPLFVKITSTAGYSEASDNDTLATALLMQGIANYNRRDMFGFAEVQGEGGTTRTPSDRGGLIDAVKELLAPLVYYGDAAECS